LVALFVIVVGAAASAQDTSPQSAPTPLEAIVARLGEETSSFDGGALWGVSVMNLDTGERVDFQGDQWIKAASALKPVWMAAAVNEAGIEAVEPLATPVFVWSNNESAGTAMRLAGGIDATNKLSRDLGMNGTLVVEWTFGTNERSRLYPGEHPYLNYTTTDDLLTFWRWLYQGAVLDAEGTATMLEWARLPKPAGPSSALIGRLPPDAAEWTSFKMGVLPPGRSYEDDEEGNPILVEGARDTILGGGVVEVPGGPTYVVAIGGFGGASWWGKVRFVEYASCRIYEVMSGDDLMCDSSADPSRTRLDTDPPTGRLLSVGGTSEFISVRGWASDPDDPFDSVLTRFSVNGTWHGITRADGRSPGSAGPVQDGHGFDTTILALLPPGEHEVCAYAINDGAGADSLIGCELFVVR
jgi:hypothetical protein